jgi:hypothetical protein
MTDRAKWTPLKRVRIEARPTGLWSVVTDYVLGSRLLRFSLLDTDPQNQPVSLFWNPASGVQCGADGIGIFPSKTGLLSPGAMYGALIGKIGGSSADIPDPSQPTSPYGSKRVFGVGSYCVISLAAAEGGPLFLTMNDNPEGFANHSGALHVLMEEYST